MNDRINPATQQDRGFTLVELLVVIGITAVATGLMMPALASVRFKAFRVRCESQVRQMAFSISAYAATERDRVPFPFRRTTMPNGTVLTTPDGRILPPEAAFAAGDFWVQPMLDDYGGSFIAEPLLCPLDNITRETAAWAATQTGVDPSHLWLPLARPISRSFYIAPQSLARDRTAGLVASDFRVARMSDVAFPSAKAFVFEEIAFHAGPATRPAPPLTISASDGSVAFRSPDDATPPVLI
ncbi:MAG: type II secretion system protein, partial [Planctomycetota bacterium]